MSKRDPKPEVLRLEELAILVKTGDIKLPRFQRPFVWRRIDMLKLLDSIYKGYPIGSLLLWNSSQRLKSERDIAGLKVSDEPTFYPTNYLLDGQQRLTTLCGALFWEGGAANSVWNIHFDLESEEFFHSKTADSATTYPLNKLIDTTDFIHQCMKLAHLENSKLYTARAERLLRTIKDYKIAVVKIGDMSIEEVAPIFERINSTGRKLTIVDLMMAATWSNGFDLSAEIQTIQSSCDRLGFTGVSEAIVLRSIAAAAGLGVNKDDIQKLRNLNPEELSLAANNCHRAVESAVSWILETLFIREASYLPYGLFFTYLVEFFRVAPSPNEQMLKEMESWFWYTSCTLYFGGASTGDITRELVNIREFSSGHRGQLFQRNPIDISRLLFDKFSLKNASSTAFALLLLSIQPTSTLYGMPIDLELIGDKSSKVFSRISPEDTADLNIAVVFDTVKNRKKSDFVLDLLPDHLMNIYCVEAIRLDDASAFINARSSIISSLVEFATGCRTTFNYENFSPNVFDEEPEDL